MIRRYVLCLIQTVPFLVSTLASGQTEKKALWLTHASGPTFNNSIFKTDNAGFSQFAAIATDEFNFVNVEMETSVPLTPELLADYDVLLVNVGGTSRSASVVEQAALREFVQRGGALFVSGEGNNPGAVFATSLTLQFGVSFFGSITGTATDFEDHPLTDGLSSVSFGGGNRLTVESGARGLATFGSSTILAVARQSPGPVIAFSDEATFFNDPTFSEAHLGLNNNRRLARNILSYLRTGTSQGLRIDFAANGNSEGWMSSRLGGADPSVQEAGLCIFTPLQGDNIGVWESPRSAAIPLVANSVYRIRFAMSTSQRIGSAQPVWNILVDNLNPSTGEILWGSERWFFGNTAFANAIGNTGFDGFNEFDAWIVPNPVTTDAWNGLVDSENSPFDASNVQAAAFNLKFRILDFEGLVPGANDEDTGTVCLRAIQVDRFDLGSLQVDGGPIWGNMAAVPAEVGVVATAASGRTPVPSRAIVTRNAGTIAIELDEAHSAGPRPGEEGIGGAFVRFEDEMRTGYLRQFPIPWNDGELLRLTSEVRAMSPDPANPVDVIRLGWEAATDEIGGSDFSFRGAPGGTMDRAASPRDDSVGNSSYTSFFYTHHSTDIDLSLLPTGADQLRAVLEFFNRTDLAGALGEGILSDPFEIRSMAVHRIVYDSATFGARPAED